MSDQTNTGLVKKSESAVMEFVPFGSQDPIKLSLNIIKNVVATRTRTGATCSDRDAIKFMMLCQAQRLNPFAGDAFLVGYDKFDKGTGASSPVFSLITSHVAFLKRAETHAEFEGMESGIILQSAEGLVSEREGDFRLNEEKVVGGWARVWRKGRKPTYRRLSIAAMKPNYETPFWNVDKAPGQIVKCAEADALRSTFPTLLGALYHAGEIMDIQSTKTATDVPASALVDVKSAAIEAGHEQNQEQPQQEPAQSQERASAVTELEKIVTDAGFTFNHLQIWAKDTGQVENADSLGSFDDVPEKVAVRLVRAKAGLLKGLAEAKKAEGQ